MGRRCALVTPPSAISRGMRPNFTPRPPAAARSLAQEKERPGAISETFETWADSRTRDDVGLIDGPLHPNGGGLFGGRATFDLRATAADEQSPFFPLLSDLALIYSPSPS